MTPTNTAMTPEIKNIADNNGDKHTVVPTPHTHSQDDVDGLAAALAAKANAIPAGSPSGAIVIVSNSGEIGRSNKTLTDLLNAIAAKQDTLTFDSTPTSGSTKLVTSGNIRKAMNAVGEIKIKGVIEDPSFVVAFENYTQWWSNGETELHYIMQKTSGSPVAVKTQFRSNTGIVYFADDLGDVSPSRWPIVTIRRGLNGTTPIFTVTLDGVYTPT